MLGGLSPEQFMRRYWHKKPLLVRQAFKDVAPPVSRADLFNLAAQDEVESRLVVRSEQGWRLRHGPFSRRGLPPLSRPAWTLLVQGLDLHVPAAHALLNQFRFVPDARMDDLMVSYASDGGGVGPHLDAYDVFLIQVQGRRRWQIGRVADDRLVQGLPLKILQHFVPEQEWVLEPGDMQWVNNYTVMHSRTEYADWPEPGRERHMLRLWLKLHGYRKLDPLQLDLDDQSGWSRRDGILPRGYTMRDGRLQAAE